MHRILVVEDDKSVRELVARALQGKYLVVEAADGLHASELIAQMPTPPALVICDVMMPRVDGLSFVRMLKRDEKLKAIPVLFLTAKTAPLDVVQGISAGARHYMTKPFKVQELVEMVEKIVR